MKSVRLFFTKKGDARFVSHLDMNRMMTRLVRKAGLDIWYTEGFNPHPYMTFALPLPLGFEGLYEIMDIRINDDNFDISKIPDIMNGVCPKSIHFFDAKEPDKKVGAIAFAEYEIIFDDAGEVRNKLSSFLVEKPIIAKKRTKKGDMKEIDLSDKIKDFCITSENGNTKLKIILPAGSNDNINPSILLEAFYNKNSDVYYCYDVTRTAILDGNMKKFK
ncbi:MAG: DUF2344 domain-containing protein [Clostridia bacterium]|nr:DUF2344 domain-containing protein [Clostridia bacterium]